MFVEINPKAAANDRGIRNGERVWVKTPTGAQLNVQALVTERVGRDTVFMPFHFSGRWQGADMLPYYPEGAAPVVRGEAVNTATTYGYDSVTMMQETKTTICHIEARRKRREQERPMARMKFICDAERCIECNGCVTACKNENEVPWGVNRRRVVTLNDGVPGERVDLGRLHALLRRALHGGVPGRLLLPHRRRRGAARQGHLHRLRLLLATPARSARRSSRRNGTFGAARQDGQVHLLRRRPRGQRLAGRVREVRPQPPGRRQAAGLRRDVLDQGAARRRRRRGGRHLPHPRAATAARAAKSGAGARPTAADSRPASARPAEAKKS